MCLIDKFTRTEYNDWILRQMQFSASLIKTDIFVCRLEMNSPLDHDFETFKFSVQNKICKDGAVELLQNFGMCLTMTIV